MFGLIIALLASKESLIGWGSCIFVGLIDIENRWFLIPIGVIGLIVVLSLRSSLWNGELAKHNWTFIKMEGEGE